jgi:hypothetical protein
MASMLRISGILLFVFFSLIFQVFGQENRLCGQEELHRLHPEWRELQKERDAFNEYASQFRTTEQTANIIKIPVVVHIMHLPSESYGVQSNITDEQILSQIEVLNEDFGKVFGTRGFNVDPVGANTEIEFCLATRDPNGNPSTGINRVPYSGSSNFQLSQDRNMKDLSRWPVNRYLNIWVVKSIQSSILGYAFLPEVMASDPERPFIDGVVMGAFYFGSIEKQMLGQNFYLSNTFAYGRTATHEVGHFLNLKHTWGDGGCEIDDDVDDTPLCSGQYFGCPPSPARPFQCGLNRMVENYMDYSDDACFNIFTLGQKNRMRAALQFYPFRASLVSLGNIVATGCSDSGGTISFADTIVKISGDTQVVRVGRTNEEPFRIRVLNQLGGGFNNEDVRWQVRSQPFGAGLVLDTIVRTAGSGFSEMNVRLSNFPGRYIFRASANTFKTPSFVEFTIDALAATNAYPNPFKDEIVLALELPFINNVQIRVTDLQGKVVMDFTTDAKEAVVLNMAGYPDNFYLVTVVSPKIIDYFKIIKITP